MKKFLITGAFTLALSAFLFSCADDDNDFSSIAEMKQATFAENFVKFYGPIDPNQDWGFGTTTAASRMTRAIQPSFEFPGDADPSKFLASVPSGVEKLPESGDSRGGTYYIDASTNRVNVYEAPGTIYIKGDCDFSNKSFFIAGGSEVFLLEGATLTLNSNDAGNLQNNCKYYIASGASIVTTSELKMNNGLHMFNHGTIRAAKLSTNSDSWLVNGGTVTISGKISVENTLSVIVNNGDITAADLNTAGSGKFENNANVTITGTTFVNSNDNTWVNNGQYHTGNFIYNAASDEVINNCRLTVDEDFNINLGDNPGNGNFKMDAGSGVVTKNFNGGGNWAKQYSTGWSAFNGGPFYIYMGANSVFKVTETATMNATKADYGIYGPSEGGYAVFQAKNIVKGAENQGYEVTYGNNLYVSAENHFANGKSGEYPYIDFKGNVRIFAPKFESGEAPITIEPSACCPGFPDAGSLDIIDLGPGTQIKDEKYEFKKVLDHKRVFCEDLGSSSNRKDYDYNDVVFDAKIIESYFVDINTNGSSEPYGLNWYAEIEVLAAGGELSLTVGGVQVNDLFGEYPTMIINTVSAEDDETFAASHNAFNNPYSPKKFTYKFNSLAEATVANIPVIARAGNTAIYLKAEKGEAPQKICVPVGTRWAYERVPIDEAYGNFASWVGHVSDFTPSSLWGTNFVEEKRYPNLGATTGEAIGAIYQVRTSSSSSESFTFNPVPTNGIIWDHTLHGITTLSNSPIRISNAGFANAGKGTVVRLYGVDEGDAVVNVKAGDVAFPTTRGMGKAYIYTLSTAQAAAAKEDGLTITGSNFKLYYVTVDNNDTDRTEFVEPTFSSNEIIGTEVSNIAQTDLSSNAVSVGGSNFADAGAGTEVYVYGSGDESTVAIQVGDSYLSKANSRQTRTVTYQVKAKKIVKFTMSAEQAAAAQTSGVTITGSDFVLHKVSVKIVKEQEEQGGGDEQGEQGEGAKAGQIWPDSGAGSAVSEFTIAKSKFTNDMVGKTLRIYSSEFGQWYWGLTLRLNGGAGDIFSGLNVPNWTNNTSHLATAINSAAKNGSCIEMALSQDLINLFKAYDVVITPNSLKITNVTVE